MVGLQLILPITPDLLVRLTLEHLIVILVVAEMDLVWSQLLWVLILIDVLLMRLLQALMTLCQHRLRNHLVHIHRHIRLVGETSA